MDAKAIDLQSLLNAPKQFLIPVFQRYYSWNLENWQQLWGDIEVLFVNGSRPRFHFMGSLVFIPVLPPPIDGNPKYQVIDGQQRLMTLTLILCALRYHASQQDQQELAIEIYRYYLVHEFRKGHERYRVYPRQRDQDHFLTAINDPADDIGGEIGNAFRFFLARIADFIAPNPPQRLRTLFDHLKTRLNFVYIQLDAENPYEIFKSLNSTGVPLSEADLIRNFVFMHVDASTQNTFDDYYWRPLEAHFEYKSEDNVGELDVALATRFFRDFLMQSGEYVRRDAVFASFENRYATDFDPVELAQELKKNAEFYDVLRGVKAHASPEVEASLSKLRRLETTTTFPLLMALLHHTAAAHVTNSELSRAVELIAGFILRRYAISESSRLYGRWFVIASRELKNKPLANLEAYLYEKGFPNDRQFQAGFATFPWYVRSYTDVVLQALERNKPHREPADLSQATIEHIMPQSLSDAWREGLGAEVERIHDEWLHTIGNLTLSAYNSELHNYPFAAKRLEYARSNIQLNRELAKTETWTEQAIIARGRSLAMEASTIWIGPSKEIIAAKKSESNSATWSADNGLTETQQIKLDYWTAFAQYLTAQGSFMNPRRPAPQPYADFAVGRSDFVLTLTIHLREKRLGVGLGLWGPDAKPHFYLLQRTRNEIEAELGVDELIWYELPNKISSHIVLENTVFDPGKRTKWPLQHAWLQKWLEAFHRCFAPRIRQLKAADWSPNP